MLRPQPSLHTTAPSTSSQPCATSLASPSSRKSLPLTPPHSPPHSLQQVLLRIGFCLLVAPSRNPHTFSTSDLVRATVQVQSSASAGRAAKTVRGPFVLTGTLHFTPPPEPPEPTTDTDITPDHHSPIEIDTDLVSCESDPSTLHESILSSTDKLFFIAYRFQTAL
uniref:Uncharacterized protein n=1 Tax=Amphora coffeiformis TaxID=265554 RepID=A0A7S3KY62_9STRA|mmetsp:Transcript_5866/g.12000  ORF Transcript_5866/g.12000 Transcript_5866/m.12000 type:complete len:166 (-) Transcript_5866:163-660(-)